MSAIAKSVLYRQGFPVMTEVVPEGTCGQARVRHHQITELEAAMANMRGLRTESEKIAVLETERGTEMSDSYNERLTNFQLLDQARGAVLVAGLGLGMVLHPLRANPLVTSLTVLEVHPDVIALIQPTLPPGIDVIEADAFTWSPPAGVKFDTIYFDIWPHITGDNYPDMKRLTTRARRWRQRGAWVGCWMKDEARCLHRSA